jgi:hypothetical protein
VRDSGIGSFVIWTAGAACACVCQVSPASALHDAHPEPSTVPHVLLTVSPQLPAIARAALVEEAEALWARAGVRLVWRNGADRVVETDRALRVLVIPRPASSRSARPDYALGELLSFGPPNALAVVSIDRVQELVNSSHTSSTMPPSLQATRIGIILGRAAAHEIGHYLLNSRSHVDKGLMRASFEVHELLDGRSGMFELDDDSKAWIQQRIAHGMPIGPAPTTRTD